MQDLGFVYYLAPARLSTAAAAWFRKRPRHRARPTWMSPLAAVTLAEGGKRSASRELWQQIAKSGEPWLRETPRSSGSWGSSTPWTWTASMRACAPFQQRYPGTPLSWDALRAAGYVRGVPLNPTNVRLHPPPIAT